MTNPNNQNTNELVYARSHPTVRINSKRFEQSPYAVRYADDETLFGCYCNRFYPLSLGKNVIEDYWRLCRDVMLYDVPEKPLDIRGPDTVALLERVFTRRIADLKTWRARYAIACTPQGGIVMDGVLIRLADDHFWYVQANGEFENWLLAHSEGLDVEVSDPNSRVLQIQGPKSLEILNAVCDRPMPEKFGYFHAAMLNIGGQDLLVSRTGWTGELGFEIYSNPGTDHLALWDHLFAVGDAFGMQNGDLGSMGVRRLEAGILDYGTDIDRSLTPFGAGLGSFVDFSKTGFVGRDALMNADKTCLLYGVLSENGVPSGGLEVMENGKVVGRIKVGDWSPALGKGIGYVVFDRASDSLGGWLGKTLTLRDPDGAEFRSEIVALPFYDADKKIPRGLKVANR